MFQFVSLLTLKYPLSWFKSYVFPYSIFHICYLALSLSNGSCLPVVLQIACARQVGICHEILYLWSGGFESSSSLRIMVINQWQSLNSDNLSYAKQFPGRKRWRNEYIIRRFNRLTTSSAGIQPNERLLTRWGSRMFASHLRSGQVRDPGSDSLSGKTSYQQVSRNIKAIGCGFKLFDRSEIWQQCCRRACQKFRVMWLLWQKISWLQNFTRSNGKIS